MTEDPRAPQGYLSTRSFAELLSKLFRDLTDLFLKETDLIRSEMNEKVTQLQTGIGKIAAGAIVLLVSLIVLSDAMVVAIAELLSSADAAGPKTGWAAVIVGGVFGRSALFWSAAARATFGRSTCGQTGLRSRCGGTPTLPRTRCDE